MKYLVLLLGALLNYSVGAQELTSLRHLGNENASVQMYLFSSYACPHCATFHQKILPQIQKKYLDNKKAYLTFVDMAGDEESLRPVLLMRCIESQKAPDLSKKLYLKQQDWAYEKGARQKLFKIVEALGMTKNDFEKCLTNRSLMEKVADQQNNLTQIYDIKKLPTLIVRRGNQVAKLEGADEKQVMDGIREFLE